jgi:O-antigen/teichoic acid export membrane protein
MYILLGMFVSGVGQIVYVAVANTILDAESFSTIVQWNSLYSIGIIVVGSPLVSLVAIDINMKKEFFSKIVKKRTNEAYTYSVIVAFVSGIMWLGTNNHRINVSFLLGGFLLSTSGFVQTLLGIQRGENLANSRWRWLSAQLCLDGFLRIVFAILLGVLNTDSYEFFIYLSGFTPIATYLILRYLDRSQSNFRALRFRPRWNIADYQSFWAASFALQVSVTLSPVVLGLKGSSSALIASLGLGLFIIRIPLTLSATFTAPMFNKFTIDAGLGDRNSSKRYLSYCFLISLLISIPVIAIVTMFGSKTVLLIGGNELLERRTVLILFAVSALGYILAIESNAYLTAYQKFSDITIGWVCGLCVFLTFMVGTPSLNRVALGLVTSSLFSFVWFLHAIFFKHRNVTANV